MSLVRVALEVPAECKPSALRICRYSSRMEPEEAVR